MIIPDTSLHATGPVLGLMFTVVALLLLAVA